MTKHTESLPAHPFFLETKSGECFCLYHTPSANTECYGTFIYIHPFAEEMNKSRRMAALQARAFTTIGYGVLQIDLFGCGDSSGEFREASWNIWKQDIAAAVNWLAIHTTAPINLWGLRLGALLALDFKKNSDFGSLVEKVIMWQPIISGKVYLNQFLRLHLANTLISRGHKETMSTRALRNSLSTGLILEVGGYELAPKLAAALDNLKISELITTENIVYWLDIVPKTQTSISSVKIELIEAWKKEGNNLHIYFVTCLPFWATQEITECSELISTTTKLFAKN